MSVVLNPPDISRLRQQLSPTPCNIVRELVRAGHEAYIVGGAIRDLLLGKVPKDYDISTSATPEEVRAVFGRRRCHVIGRRFRLAHVYANGDIYEVSTFRRLPNQQERQGRKEDSGPIIWNDNCFGTLEDDALRRDFTCNCLYFDVTGDRGIIDFCGGYGDICSGIVKCIGEPAQRFDEDPVRMLRALKLVAQCGFELEPALARALREKASNIKLASSSRLFEELLKILNNPAAHRTFQVMHDYGFLKYFWPTLDESWGEQAGEMVRHLLVLRGEAMTSGHYSNSRGLALATVVLPFIMFALNPENPAELWKNSAETDEIFRRALDIIFEGFQLPHVFQERLRQIVCMVPRLLNGSPASRQKSLANPEYRYARALLLLLTRLFGWSQDKLQELPEFSPVFEEQLPQGRRRRRKRKGAQAVNNEANEQTSAASADEYDDEGEGEEDDECGESADADVPAEPEDVVPAATEDVVPADMDSGMPEDEKAGAAESAEVVSAVEAETVEVAAPVESVAAEVAASEESVEISVAEVIEPVAAAATQESAAPAEKLPSQAENVGAEVTPAAEELPASRLVPLRKGGTVPRVLMSPVNKRLHDKPRVVFLEYIAPAPVEGMPSADSITFSPHGHSSLLPLHRDGARGERRHHGNRQRPQ